MLARQRKRYRTNGIVRNRKWAKGRMILPILCAVYFLQMQCFAGGSGNWLLNQTRAWIPLMRYTQLRQQKQEGTWRMARASYKEALPVRTQEAPAKSQPIQDEQPVTPQVPQAKGREISMDQLRDFQYLIGNFYNVDSSTMIGPEQLDPDDLLSRDMRIDTTTGGPKVLIFHTHSQEAFADSEPGNPQDSIVGVGEYLTQLLNAKGIETLHDTGVYDIIDGKLDRSNAYENAEASVRPILEANPSIEVAIDLHRDGVREETHLVTEIGGKQTARIMYFNGLSRTRVNGDIPYLYNPYIQDNLAFSLQMQLESEREYPGFVRPIYLRAYRYNLHLLPKSLLIEAGAQTNTIEEMRNAMEVLAETLYQVLVAGA